LAQGAGFTGTLEQFLNLPERQIIVKLNDVERALQKVAEVEARFAADVDGWTNKDGGFNASRLGADLAGTAVVGAGAGVLTNVIMKKSQLAKGYESIRCSVGGQSARYGQSLAIY
jgi:hypothetical protein